MLASITQTPITRDRFIATLKEQVERYHHTHPFHIEMNAGKLSKKQIQVWTANRFYYQKSIPLKDAAILSNCPEISVRRVWVQCDVLWSMLDAIQHAVEEE